MKKDKSDLEAAEEKIKELENPTQYRPASSTLTPSQPPSPLTDEGSIDVNSSQVQSRSTSTPTPPPRP